MGVTKEKGRRGGDRARGDGGGGGGIWDVRMKGVGI